MAGTVGKPKAPAGYRWVVLAAFMATSVVAQMLWITFSSLPPCSTAVLCPTTDNITYLTAIYPIVFVVISIPTGYLIDARGFRLPVLIGALCLAVSGILRPFSPSFAVLLAIQGVGAVGQPFILNSISKLVRAWFPAEEVATATGLGTLSIFVGLALGFGLTPVLASQIGAKAMLEVFGVVSVLAFAFFAAAAREPGGAFTPEKPPTFREIFGMLKVRNIALLSVLFFVGIGIFNSFATYLQPMLGARSVSASDAGLLGGVMIVGGIVGALVISVIADKYKTLRKPILGCLGLAVTLWALVGIGYGTLIESLVLLALGFFFMASLPLGLELSARSVSPSSEGAANAVVWEFSQIGGSVLIFVFDGVGLAYGWGLTFYLAAALAAVMLLASLGLDSK